MDRLLTTDQLAEVTGHSASFYNKARLVGNGPPFITIGRTIRYRQIDVENWLYEQSHQRTDAQAGRAFA